ncbi:MAG: hypothetical protein ACR2KB_06565, partial [Chitinophagaceae bacterium]
DIHDSLKARFLRADTVKAIGYHAICLYQIRKSDQSVRKDTTYITLNLDMNIVEQEILFNKREHIKEDW